MGQVYLLLLRVAYTCDKMTGNCMVDLSVNTVLIYSPQSPQARTPWPEYVSEFSVAGSE